MNKNAKRDSLYPKDAANPIKPLTLISVKTVCVHTQVDMYSSFATAISKMSPVNGGLNNFVQEPISANVMKNKQTILSVIIMRNCL